MTDKAVYPPEVQTPTLSDLYYQELIEPAREHAIPYTANVDGKIQTWRIFYYV